MSLVGNRVITAEAFPRSKAESGLVLFQKVGVVWALPFPATAAVSCPPLAPGVQSSLAAEWAWLSLSRGPRPGGPAVCLGTLWSLWDSGHRQGQAPFSRLTQGPDPHLRLPSFQVCRHPGQPLCVSEKRIVPTLGGTVLRQGAGRRGAQVRFPHQGVYLHRKPCTDVCSSYVCRPKQQPKTGP